MATMSLWLGRAGGAAGLYCEPGVPAFRPLAGPPALPTVAAGMEFAGPAHVHVAAPQPVWTQMPLPPAGVGCGCGGGGWLMLHSQPESNAALHWQGLGLRQQWHIGGWGGAGQGPMLSWPA